MISIRNPQSAIRNAFTAVLVAGGRSTRMGRDKAALVIDGQPLWQRQLATLRATGAAELLISGRKDGPFAASGVAIIEDLTPHAGPLAALEAALARVSTPFIVVLGIDLPMMRADFLERLMQAAERAQRSVVPEMDGRFEPLAAVYTSEVLPLVAAALRSADRSMQRFVRAVLAQDLAVAHPLSAKERPLFQNLNSPADLA